MQAHYGIYRTLIFHKASMPAQAPSPTVLTLSIAILRLGLVAFGGLGATLTLLQRDLVDRRGWLDAQDWD